MGSRDANAVLTSEQVRVIRRELAANKTPQYLARIYRVSVETIRRIGRRESWNWIEEEVTISEEEFSRPATAAEESAAQASLARFQALLAVDKQPAAQGYPVEEGKTIADLKIRQQTEEEKEEMRKRLEEQQQKSDAALKRLYPKAWVQKHLNSGKITKKEARRFLIEERGFAADDLLEELKETKPHQPAGEE